VAKPKKSAVSRRGFLKGAAASAAAGAAAIVAPAVTNAEASAAQQVAQRTTPAVAASVLAAEARTPATDVEVMTVENPGSDFMVDIFKSLGFEYIASNPASSFRGVHESFITYGGNKNPEWITCCHEESSVAIASGYYAVEGKPMAVATFVPAGLQHSAMTLYGAYASHTPVYVIVGNHLDAARRRPGIDWSGHSVQDAGALVRDFVKWDDTPISLQHFAESAVRAYKIAMTAPYGPVLLVADSSLQEDAVPDRSKLRIPKLTLAQPPAGDSKAIAEAAKLLVAAQSPLIIAGDVARDEEGRRLLVELAETLQAPVQGGGRGMPNRHPLSGGGRVGNADVILGLNLSDFFGAIHNFRDQQEVSLTSLVKPGTKLINITAYDLDVPHNYQNLDRYMEMDISIAADPQASLPVLIEACKRLITADRRRVFDERGKALAAASAQALERARVEATYGWNESPITTARLSVEVWNAIKNKDWASVGGGGGRLWNNDKFYRFMGDAGGGGVGGGLPIAVGAALAHKKHGRLCVRIQTDGDFMVANGALWTAVHHRIPMLFVMHNNRAYHQEVMHVQRMGNRRQRGMGNAHIGTVITDPNVDFAMLARSMGAYGEGPITDPKDLGPALRRAIERVEKGEVALVDSVTQPR
jgi:acetolactate synthase I/II/III large subunit